MDATFSVMENQTESREVTFRSDLRIRSSETRIPGGSRSSLTGVLLLSAASPDKLSISVTYQAAKASFLIPVIFLSTQ
jgi:hypothetical protein